MGCRIAFVATASPWFISIEPRYLPHPMEYPLRVFYTRIIFVIGPKEWKLSEKVHIALSVNIDVSVSPAMALVDLLGPSRSHYHA
jgi:hypothetical protein